MRLRLAFIAVFYLGATAAWLFETDPAFREGPQATLSGRAYLVTSWGTIGLFAICVGSATIFSLQNFVLVVFYKLHHYRNPGATSAGYERYDRTRYDDSLPYVTVQCPVYNESHVVERLMEACAKLDYPADKLEIHVLDDSTDETVDIVARKVASLRAEHDVNIRHIRRKSRDGFKAGAMRDAMEFARGEFIAVFDADFDPRPDWLLVTLPPFEDEKVACVQTRWEHTNAEYSLLTVVQEFHYSVHWTVEKMGRMEAGVFLQFNGTAGIWRRAAVDEAGGWEPDTLTEDIDLSFRVQSLGWRIHYLEEYTTPCDLPFNTNVILSQQFRWNKGLVQVMFKNWPVLRDSAVIPWWKKAVGLFHLNMNFIFPMLTFTLLLSLPAMYFMHEAGVAGEMSWLYVPGMNPMLYIYWVGNVESPPEAVRARTSFLWRAIRFFFIFPLYMSLSFGYALRCTLGYFDAWLGRRTGFVRTPKYDPQRLAQRQFPANAPQPSWWSECALTLRGALASLHKVNSLEGFAGAYAGLGILYGLHLEWYTLIPIHILACFGLTTVFIYNVIGHEHLELVDEAKIDDDDDVLPQGVVRTL